MTGTDIAMPVLGGERVLVVEDGEDSAATLTAVLRLNGFDARAVRTAAAARAAVDSGRPRVVLLDLGLPDADGEDLLQSLRAVPDPPAVVVVTGRGEPKWREAATAAGAAGFFIKPADPDALVAAVRRLCEPNGAC
jgi:DNA-binding response OmpR family regulator